MKKITSFLFALMVCGVMWSQTYSTGVMELHNADNLLFTAQVEITGSTVTLTLNGPDGRYLGFGFGTQSMLSNGDVFMFYDDPATEEVDFKITDRTFINAHALPAMDEHQDWTLISNTAVNGQRTVVASRPANTGHDGDYVFSNSDVSLSFVWAFGHSYTLGYHAKRGASMQAFTLNTDLPSAVASDIKMSPNPSNSVFELTVSPHLLNGKIEIFDVLGKRILRKNLAQITTKINVSNWNNGVYLVRLSTDEGVFTKRFLRQ